MRTYPKDLRYWRHVPVDTIFGQTFVQGRTPGVASYHFDSPDDCYISYSAAPPSWRRADGSAPPARQPFLSPAYDAATRTFTGTIDWGDNPFGGAARWEYTMVFTEHDEADEYAFDRICDGVVRTFRPDGSEEDQLSRFGRQLHYERLMEEKEDLVALVLAMREAEAGR